MIIWLTVAKRNRKHLKQAHTRLFVSHKFLAYINTKHIKEAVGSSFIDHVFKPLMIAGIRRGKML